MKTLLASLASLAHSKKIECPLLKCNERVGSKTHLEDNMCFQHDYQHPTLNIIGEDCLYFKTVTDDFEGNVVCDFELLSGDYAWVQEETQHLKSDEVYSDDPTKSQLY